MRAGELNGWWRLALVLILPVVRLVFRVRVAGLDHVPRSGGTILAFNHVSLLDGPVLAVETGWRIRRPLRFLVASEIFGKWPWGWILRRYEQIPVRRGEQDRDAFDAALAEASGHGLLAIAPEGRVDDVGGADGLQRLKSGVARIALSTGVPVVPVGIWGTQWRWPRAGIRWSRPLRPRLAIAYGPPLLPTVGDETPDSFSARLRPHLEEQVRRARRLAGEVA